MIVELLDRSRRVIPSEHVRTGRFASPGRKDGFDKQHDCAFVRWTRDDGLHVVVKLGHVVHLASDVTFMLVSYNDVEEEVLQAFNRVDNICAQNVEFDGTYESGFTPWEVGEDPKNAARVIRLLRQTQRRLAQCLLDEIS